MIKISLKNICWATTLFSLLAVMSVSCSSDEIVSGLQEQSQTAMSASSDGDFPEADPIIYLDQTPLIVDVSVVENVQFWLKTDGTITSAEIEHDNGHRYPLVKYVSGLFGITLSHDRVLYGYDSTNLPNRNRFGYLNLYIGGTQQGHYIMEIGVYDDQIPDVNVANIAGDMQSSPHLVNIVKTYSDPSTLTAQEITQRFYQVYGDGYDFLNLIFTPKQFKNRSHVPISNAISGIGLSIYSNASSYGSSGKLKGYNYYPLPTYYDAGERTMSHETAHQWLQYLDDVPELQGMLPHWPISEVARSVMGFNTQPWGQGLRFSWDLTPLGNGNYQVTANPSADIYFNGMDLYLMGLGSAAEAGSYVVFTNQNQTLGHGGTLYGPTVTFDAQDVIAEYGVRSPAYPSAQSHFRMGTIIISNHLLTEREMAYFDYFTRRGEATVPLGKVDFTNIETLIPWAVATGWRSTISTGLGSNCSESNPINLFFFSHRVDPDPPVVGQEFSFIAGAVNTSENTARRVTFFDYLPDGVEFVSATIGGNASCYGDKLIVCTQDTFYAGESVTLEVTVRPTKAGEITHTVGISSCNYDMYPSNNYSALTVTVNPAPVSNGSNYELFLPLLNR
jgi:uncharacterized repeat protein (TIGR01451 family)